MNDVGDMRSDLALEDICSPNNGDAIVAMMDEAEKDNKVVTVSILFHIFDCRL